MGSGVNWIATQQAYRWALQWVKQCPITSGWDKEIYSLEATLCCDTKYFVSILWLVWGLEDR